MFTGPSANRAGASASRGGRRRAPEPKATLPLKALYGAPVRSASGEVLGVVREVILRRDPGEIAYVVIGAGGLLGWFERRRILAWETLRLPPGRRDLVAEAPEDGGTAPLRARRAMTPSPFLSATGGLF